MFQIGEFKHIKNGYFDMFIKRGSNEKWKTYFPRGTSVQKAVEILENAIKNPKNIKFIGNEEKGIIAYRITSQPDDIFHIYIENKKTRFYPVNPESITK